MGSESNAPRAAEVGQDEVSVGVEQHVLRLEVAVHNPVLVEVLEREAKLSQVELCLWLLEEPDLRTTKRQVWGHHIMVYPRTRWPESPRIVMQCVPMSIKWP